MAVVVECRGPGARSWRLAAVVADTWKGFSNLAGLSSTVTFVTVTHAILEDQPSTAKNQVRRSSVIQRRASVTGRARTRACWSRRGLKGERLVVHTCACVSGPTHLRVVGAEPMCPRAHESRWRCARSALQGGKAATPLFALVQVMPCTLSRTSEVPFRVKRSQQTAHTGISTRNPICRKASAPGPPRTLTP